jgi:alkaline phosphatase D
VSFSSVLSFHSFTNESSRHYRQVYGSPDWPGAGDDLPWLHVVDDHEIANDWDRNVTGIYQTAMDPFHIYQHSTNPPPHRVGETYYSFKHGPASFFMIDSRRYRTAMDAPDGPHKTLLGHRQLQDVLDWIKDDSATMENVQWKFFVTSSAFTQNWKINANDSWAGYLYERQQILEAMWEQNGKFGFVVLSGDRHEFAATA